VSLEEKRMRVLALASGEEIVKCECESEREEKRSGNEMDFLTPTLTPALFSALQA